MNTHFTGLRSSLSITLLLACSVLISSGVLAATYTYDFDGNSANGVTNGNGGTWSTSSALWFQNTSTTDIVWPNNGSVNSQPPDSAIFGDGTTAAGTLQAVKTAGNLYVNSITFNSVNAGGSYSLGLDGTGAGHILFEGTTPTVTTNALADIYTRMTATSFTKAGSGTLIIRNNANNLGDVVIQAGNLDVYQVLTTTSVTVQGTAKWDTHSGDTWNMGTVTYSTNQTSNLSAFGATSNYTVGSGGLTLNSGGINVLAGDGAASSVTSNFTINGLLTINGGSLSLQSSNAALTPNSTAKIVLNADVVVNAATATISHSGVGTELFDLGGGVRTFTINESGNPTPVPNVLNLNVVVTNGGIIKAGVGTLSLGGAESNTYTGLTTLNAGTLKLAKSNNINAVAGDISITSGVLDWDQSNQINDTSSITLGGSGFLNFDAFNETFANLTITGNGNVNNAGGSNNGFVTITGTLQADAIGGTSGGRSVNLNSGSQWFAGTVNLISGFTGNGSGISLNGNSSRMTLFTVGTGGITLNGQAIVLQKAGGTGNLGSELALNGDLTATGTNVIRFDTGNVNGVSQVNLREGIRNWDITGTTTVTSALVSLNAADGTSTPVRTNVVGGIEKKGTGTLILSNVNTYIGSTTITAGTLKLSTFSFTNDLILTTVIGSIDNSPLITIGTAGTFDVRDITGFSVKSGQKLQGGGSVLGATTIASGAILSAGTTGGDETQTLAFSAGLTLASGSNTYLDLSTPADSDRLAVTGTLTQDTGAKIIVGPSTYAATLGQTFNLLDWTTSYAFSSNLGAILRDGSGDNTGFDLDLPDIASTGYFWDLSNFTTSGIISVVVAPEPGRSALLMAGLAVLCMRRKRASRTITTA